MLIDVGQVVAKKYELVRLLGRGSMGEVWSAHHQALREQVALKLLTWPSGEDAEDPSVALERFRFEAQVAARLSRKTRHIARVTDYGEEDGLPYLVMELLDGEALDATLRQRGPLPVGEAAPIVSQIARALGQAHAESVAHRDLKPANVFLTRDEEGRLLVKLLDFGIARTIHAHRVQGTFSTAKGFVFGTPGYMSPEQTRASPKLDHRCDLWALATIAYQMLSGELPVDGGDSEEIMKNLCAGRIVPLKRRVPNLPDALGAFFDRAFADRLEDRFDGAAALAQAFELACDPTRLDVAASSPSIHDTGTGTEFSASVAQHAMQQHRRTRTKVALVSGVVVVTAVVALSSGWRGLTGPRVQRVAASESAEALPAGSIERSVVAPALSGEAQPPVDPLSRPTMPSASPASPAALAAPAAPAAPAHASSVPAVAERSPSAAAPQVHPKAPADPALPRPVHGNQRPPEDRNDVF